MVFQFARVGNDYVAAEFLRKLGEDSPVSEFVDTLSGYNLMDLIGMGPRDFRPEDLQKVCTAGEC